MVGLGTSASAGSSAGKAASAKSFTAATGSAASQGSSVRSSNAKSASSDSASRACTSAAGASGAGTSQAASLKGASTARASGAAGAASTGSRTSAIGVSMGLRASTSSGLLERTGSSKRLNCEPGDESGRSSYTTFSGSAGFTVPMGLVALNPVAITVTCRASSRCGSSPMPMMMSTWRPACS